MEIKYEINKERLNEFLENKSTINIFSSVDMAEVFEKSRGFKVFPLIAEENGTIYAFAVGILIDTLKWLPFKFFKRLVLFTSPVYEENEIGREGFKLILNELEKITKKYALYFEIRNNIETNENVKDLLKEYTYLPYQNYLIDLSEGKEELFNKLNSFTRNHISKYRKKGAIICDVEECEVPKAIEIIKQLYHSKNIPLINDEVFYNAYKLLKPKNQIKFIVMKYNDEIIGTRIGLAYKEVLYDWYAAALSEYKNFYPNDGLVWYMINWGIENNYKIFDFGGGALKGEYYGPAKFKEKYRGKLVEFGRYRYIPNKYIFKLFESIYNKLKKD